MPNRTCEITDCDRAYVARGMCHKHWRAARRAGMDTLTPAPPLERFLAKVNKTGSCWLWTGALKSNGYGAISVDAQPTYAHRLSYELHVGPIADGMVIDHLCRVRNCVNPRHLEAVTLAINVGRGVSPSTLTHRLKVCQRGHAQTQENVYRRRCGRTMCRPCCVLREERRRGRRKRVNGRFVTLPAAVDARAAGLLTPIKQEAAA